MTRKALSLCAALAAALPGAVAGQDGFDPKFYEEERYETCVRMTRSAPDRAYEEARSWEVLGGGAPARHCVALALYGMGQYDDAATMLESVAEELPEDTPPELRAGVLAQAAKSWEEVNQLERAVANQTTALKLVPDNPDLLTDRALTLALAGNYWEAIDDLNRVIELNPYDADAFVFRASAYRFVDATELALEDADQALLLDPEHPEGLLERGNIRRLIGDTDGARADWLKLVELHGGRPAADAAQRNLEILDLKAD